MQKYGIQKHDLTQKRDKGNSRKIVKGVPGGSRVAMPHTAEEKDPWDFPKNILSGELESCQSLKLISEKILEN